MLMTSLPAFCCCCIQEHVTAQYPLAEAEAKTEEDYDDIEQENKYAEMRHQGEEKSVGEKRRREKRSKFQVPTTRQVRSRSLGRSRRNSRVA